MKDKKSMIRRLSKYGNKDTITKVVDTTYNLLLRSGLTPGTEEFTLILFIKSKKLLKSL